MANELYQLVAIDKNNIEYVIELKNDNKKNKGTLDYIDCGTAYFKDSNALAEYLFENGKIPTKNVEFFIRYNYKEEKRLSVIYNEHQLRKILRQDNVNFRKLGRDVFKQFIEFFKEPAFRNYFFNLGYKERSLNKSDRINSKLYSYITEYYNMFLFESSLDIQDSESFQYKLSLEDKIFDELAQYKQIRTVFILVKRYRAMQQEKFESEYREKNDSRIMDYEDLRELPEEYYDSYKNGGLEELFGITDLDDLNSKRLKR